MSFLFQFERQKKRVGESVLYYLWLLVLSPNACNRLSDGPKLGATDTVPISHEGARNPGTAAFTISSPPARVHISGKHKSRARAGYQTQNSDTECGHLKPLGQKPAPFLIFLISHLKELSASVDKEAYHKLGAPGCVTNLGTPNSRPSVCPSCFPLIETNRSIPSFNVVFSSCFLPVVNNRS